VASSFKEADEAEPGRRIATPKPKPKRSRDRGPPRRFLAASRLRGYPWEVRHALLLLTLPTLIGLLLMPTSVEADIYRCVSSDGSIHFTNVRERGMRCTVEVRSSGSSMAGRPGKAPAKNTRPAARGPAPPPPPTVGAVGRERYRLYDAHISEASRLYQLPEPFIRAIIRVESDFNPNVVSRVGAMGLMQLMPRTAANMGVRSPYDPRQNILGGTRYLRILANKFNGDLVLTVAGYNAGEGAVLRYRGVPPYLETRRYVRRVLGHYYRYRAEGGRP